MMMMIIIIIIIISSSSSSSSSSNNSSNSSNSSNSIGGGGGCDDIYLCLTNITRSSGKRTEPLPSNDMLDNNIRRQHGDLISFIFSE
jgi:hypothetical protein